MTELLEREEENERIYRRSIENCFSQQAVNDYAFKRYGASYYESNPVKANSLLEDHLEKQDAVEREAVSAYQEKLAKEYRDIAESLFRHTGGAALAGCLLESEKKRCSLTGCAKIKR